MTAMAAYLIALALTLLILVMIWEGLSQQRAKYYRNLKKAATDRAGDTAHGSEEAKTAKYVRAIEGSRNASSAGFVSCRGQEIQGRSSNNRNCSQIHWQPVSPITWLKGRPDRSKGWVD